MSETRATPLLVVEDVACRRGGVPVLEGVNFTLCPGEALTLRGPNGAGKTTLLRTIAGLTPPAAGRVRLPPGGAAYAGHADGLKATLTAGENLAFWSAIHGGSDPRPALDALGIARLADRPAGLLSAGQARRLGLARLLVARRRLWLLDEPSVSLDTDGVALLARLIADHLAGGGAVLAATHADLGIPGGTLDVACHRATAPVEPDFADPF